MSEGATKHEYKTHPQERKYSWLEVSQHNTIESAWVYAHDNVYDITDFIGRHPGGRDMLLLVAGRDITDLIEAYHPFSAKPKHILPKYRIGTLKGSSEFGTFKPDSGFYKECRSDVAKYFETNNLDYKSIQAGIWRYIFNTCLIIIPWFIVWSHAFDLSLFTRWILMIIAGCFQGMLLIHTMHDCSHTAFSHSPHIWKYMGRICMDLTCGCSFDAWLHQHVVGHHIYTNIIEVDPDCPLNKYDDIRRLMPSQQWHSSYRYQWIYLPMFYCLYAFKNRIQDLTQTLFGGYNGAMRVNPEFCNLESYTRQIICKSLWFLRAVIYPIFYLNNSFWFEFLVLFLSMELMTGYYLTFNFQVSHISTEVRWPQAIRNKTGKLIINGEWAKLQVETSVDYGHNSLFQLCAFWSGALNYQSIHHLFPSVSQYHYPAIAPIVRNVCAKYNVQFNHIPTFTQAFAAHVRQLYHMGMQPNEYRKTVINKQH